MRVEVTRVQQMEQDARGQVLPQEVWTERQARHEARVDELLAGHHERAGRGQAHPVEDFLFTYYSFRPAALRRWHPGAGVGLADPAALDRLAWRDHVLVRNRPDGGPDDQGLVVALDSAAFLARRGEAVQHVIELLTATAGRPAQLGCFGLHEWAMVYRQTQEEVRHNRWPLRLGAAGTDDVVEGSNIRCTHHDAFRFFTAPAVPRNEFRPTRADQISMEQPGCLHATMDLYKWAYKLSPAVPGDLVLDCFELARDTRELDMRAAPYDLAALGYQPIRIETPEGRADYVRQQRVIAERGAVARARLLTFLQGLPAATG